ncbi:hypothetical protein [Micromonospora sp. WMMC250]|uniref:hypothetical protein n=1 Tax=Micromonospora sp. WMMC250 TaxID=3014781 RepID=UPI0022B65C4A|nr:hypothetical protein [Micromonospora sp. WMMC250]MCZ7375918.1 hypothetical protein [Micromonospora sp. WMMC250]
MTDAASSSLAALIDLVDSHMQRVLKGREDPVEVVSELMSGLIDLPVGADRGIVGRLYGIYGDLSDIVDGYPFNYDAGTEMIAQREIRDAAWDWLSSPRDAHGIKTYMDQWGARIQALPSKEGGRPFRAPGRA